MKLNEIEPKLELFKAIQERSPTLKLFQITDAETLDNFYLNKFGERTATNVVIANPINMVAQMLCGIYERKWNDLYDTTISLSETFKGVSKVETETYEEQGTENNTTTNTEQVSAYDSDVFVDDNTNSTVSDGSTTNNYTRTKTTDNPFINYENIFSFMETDEFLNTVFNDINSFITLKIFEVE